MKQFTHLYGTLNINCETKLFEISVEFKDNSMLFPVTPQMEESSIKKILLNYSIFRSDDYIQRSALLKRTLNTMRARILEALLEDSVVLTKEFFDINSALTITSIGSIDSKEDGAILIPKDALVMVVIQAYPIKFKNNASDYDVVSDYLSESY